MINKNDYDSLKHLLKDISHYYNFGIKSKIEVKNSDSLFSDVEAFFIKNKWTFRKIQLDRGFSNQESIGYVLAFNKVVNKACILKLIGGSSYYYYYENGKKKRKSLDSKRETEFFPYAFCFYEFFPNRVLSLLDVFVFSFKGIKRFIPWIAIAAFFCGLLSMVAPVLIKHMSGDILNTANRVELKQILVLSIFLMLSKAIIEFIPTICFTTFSNISTERLLVAFYDRILKLPTTFFKDQQSGQLTSILHKLLLFQAETANYVIADLHYAFVFLFSMIILFVFSWKLTAILLLLLGIYSIIYLMIITYTRNLKLKAAAQMNKTIGWYGQVFNAIDKIRNSNAEDRFANYRNNQDYKYKDFYCGYTIGNKNIALAMEVIPMLANLSFMCLLANYSSEKFEIAMFIAYQSTLALLITAYSKLLFAFRKISFDLFGLKPILTLFNAVPESEDWKAEATEFDGSIKLSHVAFGYEGSNHLIINDISLSIKPGEFVAFVGPSGSGKTTLLKLLLGFEKPLQGQIFYSNLCLADLNKDSVRKQLGVILQNSKVLPVSIRENIDIAHNCTEEELQEIIKIASLEDILVDLPLGLDTIVNSSIISGGQEQRIMIARALARKPKILIMDEATSALDNKTQGYISEKVDKLKMTRVVIAHRLSTIINADRIYVLKDGKIAESGTYQELMANKGFFYKLALRQTI